MKTKAKLLLCSLVLSCSALAFSETSYEADQSTELQTSAAIRESDSINIAFKAKMVEMFENEDLFDERARRVIFSTLIGEFSSNL